MIFCHLVVSHLVIAQTSQVAD